MERIIVDRDISLFCVPAVSFPDGVMAAHIRIHELAPAADGRIYFGISRPENGVISYMAGAKELYAGEGDQIGGVHFIIPKGNYNEILVRNYMQHIPEIGHAFQQLITQPDVDPDGYCIEWYVGENDMRCMVRVAD